MTQIQNTTHLLRGTWRELRSLAERFALDVPLFVGKALEVSLRRDASNTEVRP